MSIACMSLNRDLLREVIASGPLGGLPLHVRHDMERRFDLPFGDVLLFHGPGAHSLCAKIGARAFTIGRYIFFGAGEWRAEQPSGSPLLAHELAHVLQQRGTHLEQCNPMLGVGAPDDQAEIEADLIADQIMRGRARASITRDESGLLRRMLTFDPKTATIVVDTTNSVPAVTVSAFRKLCYMHLTRGANFFISPPPGVTHVTPAMASAINLQGRVDGFYDNLENDNIGDLQRWRFRMRQITQINEMSAVYAGQQKTEGALKFDYALPPLAPATASLSYVSDAVKSAIPFMNANMENVLPQMSGKTRITNDMDDHPKWGAVLAQLNNNKSAVNFLFEAVRDQEFISAFVAIDPHNKATILAHVRWRAYWKIRCKWVGMDCRPQLISSKFDVDKAEQGPPDDSDQATLLTDLTADYSKTANGISEVVGPAERDHDIGVQFMSEWPASVPTDFYTP